MGYDDVLMRIERIANGWIVECYEPSPKPKGKSSTAVGMGSDWAEYAFTDKPGKPAIDEVTSFVKEKLPKLERNAADEYNKAFDEAAAEDD